ncbi:MAG TPA: gluconate 2-dehydrogenase subunit 3 family protein [Candidatus Eremiobacteraceae bacterium]|nr:gluconate 2-dehydrogenase subunit 3 family protein [Candidatus Eremiobacteraceae bacterium]
MPEIVMPDCGDVKALYSRRALLEAGLGIAGAIALCRSATALVAAPADAHGSTERRFFNASESRTVEAIVAQIIPTDETPGAREMGVARFIDHALAGFLAPLAGPFRAGLADFDTQYRSRNPAAEEFASLAPVRQVEWLRQVERTPFFASLQQLTVLGALTMPQYGGNRDGLGWQLIGFADEHAFAPPFGYYDRDYPGFGAEEPLR